MVYTTINEYSTNSHCALVDDDKTVALIQDNNNNNHIVNIPNDPSENDDVIIVQIEKIYLMSKLLAVDFLVNNEIVTKGIPIAEIDCFEVYEDINKVTIISQGEFAGSLTVEFDQHYRFMEFYREIIMEELLFEPIVQYELEEFIEDSDFISYEEIETAFQLTGRPMPMFFLPPASKYDMTQSTVVNRLKLHCSIMIEEFETFQFRLEQDLTDPEEIEEELEESEIVCIVEQDESKVYPQYEIVEPPKIGAKPKQVPLPKRHTKWKVFSKKTYKKMFVMMIEMYKSI